MISLMATGKPPGALSRVTRRHSIISQMNFQGGSYELATPKRGIAFHVDAATLGRIGFTST